MMYLDQAMAEEVRRLTNWLRRVKGEWISLAEALPLRRDMVTLLTYLRDNRVTGTRSTGNLTLKAVREVTARFVNPPELDVTIGDHVYRLRSEYDVWPLYFLHTLAHVAGLLEGGPGRRWRLTSSGDQFLNLDPLGQVWFLLLTWWESVNWLIAFPFAGMGEDLPSDLEEITLTHLLALPVDTLVSFEPFANDLIQEAGLQWGGQAAPYGRELLHTAIRRMVIDILADFGIVEPKHEAGLLGDEYPDLVAFRITPFGRWLLEALRV